MSLDITDLRLQPYLSSHIEVMISLQPSDAYMCQYNIPNIASDNG